MEKDHIGWRKMYSETERRHLGRWKTTVTLMDEEIVLCGNANAALHKLDKLFKSLTAFMKMLQK